LIGLELHDRLEAGFDWPVVARPDQGRERGIAGEGLELIDAGVQKGAQPAGDRGQPALQPLAGSECTRSLAKRS